MEKHIKKQRSPLTFSPETSNMKNIYGVNYNLKSTSKAFPSVMKLRREKTEVELKRLDKKIDELKKEIYQEFAPAKKSESLSSTSKASQIGEYIRKKGTISFQDEPCIQRIQKRITAKEYSHIGKKVLDQIIEILKNETYEKPDDETLNDDSLLESVLLSDRRLYAQWILQVLIDKIPKKLLIDSGMKPSTSPLLEKLLLIRKILEGCYEVEPDSFYETLEFLDNNGVKILNKKEVDYLIHLHVTARIRALFELQKMAKLNYVDLIRLESTKALSSEARTLELQKKHLEVLYKLKNFLEEMQRISSTDVLFAVTKCRNINLEANEVKTVYNNFRNYLKCVSGETTDKRGIKYSSILTKEHLQLNEKVRQLFKSLDDKLLECEEEAKKDSQNLPMTLAYIELQKEKAELMTFLKEFIEKMQYFGINDIDDVFSSLISLKGQIKTVLIKHWKFQKLLLKYEDEESEDNTDGNESNAQAKQHHTTGLICILHEQIEETKYQLQMMDEMEFCPSFATMARLGELRDKKDALIERFRNFLIRIQYQTIDDELHIKKYLHEFDHDCYELNSDYYKYKTQLEVLFTEDSKIVNDSFCKFEEMTEMHKESLKKKPVELQKWRKLQTQIVKESGEESSVVIARIDKLHERVEETKFHLYKLDERIVSKSFPAMASMCEFHQEKEEIINSFIRLLEESKRFNIEDVEKVMSHLQELNFEAEVQANKYTALGMMLLAQRDVMAIINRKAVKLFMQQADGSDKESGQHYLEILETSLLDLEDEEIQDLDMQLHVSMKISDVFGETEELKRHHKDLDRAIGKQWFPSQQNLHELRKEKRRIIHQFKNLLERTPDLENVNLLSIMSRLRELIRGAEKVMYKFQSLRMQVMCIAGAPTMFKEHKKYKPEDLTEKVMFVIRDKIRRFENMHSGSAS